MDSLSILIKSILQAPSDAEINKVKTELKSKLNNININTSGKGIKLLDTKEIDIYVQKMQNQLSRLQIGKGKVFENVGVQEELTKFTQSLELFKNKGAISTKEVGLQFDNLKTKVAQVSGEFKNVNKDGYAFTDMLTLAAKKLIIWKVAGDAIFAVIKLFQQIPDIVSKIDESLTEVNKVLDLSTSQMKALAEEATNLGIAYGKTTVEVINSIGSFAKAGLDQETSKQFASLAALLSNVGNISTEVAEKTLIMANAGYQLGNDYKTLNGLISQFNELANRNAIEVDTLAESWQMSASVAKQAKIDIADYNALITVAGSVSQRSGREVGNALRTWFMRLQGVTDGADTLEEDISKVDKVLSDLGIKLRKSPTEFRPAMEVITEIAAKYKELGKAGETVKQSELLESLAGKYRANIVAGVLANFDQVNKALNDQANSFMSAEKENARYMDSIKARTQALQAQWELLSSHVLDSDIIKGIVELGRVLVQVLDTSFVRFIGTAALLTGAIYGLGAAFKALKIATIFDGIASSVALMTSNIVGLQVGLGLLTAKLKVLTVAMLNSPLFWAIAGGLAITGIITAVKSLSEEYEKQVEKLEALNTEYETLNSTLDETKGQLANITDRINELNNKDTLTFTEEDELTRLKEINTQLENQLINQQALIDLKNKEREQQAIDILNARKNKNPDAQISYTASPMGGRMMTSTELTEVSDIEYIQKHIRLYEEYDKKIRELTGTEENYKEVLDDLTNKRDESYNIITETLGSVNEIQKSISGVTEEGSILKIVINGINDTVAKINESRGIIISLEQAFSDTGEDADNANNSIHSYNSAVEKSQEALDDFSSSAKTLSSVWKTLNDGEKLSTETMIGLIKKYPEYTSEILAANESRETALELTNKLWEVESRRGIRAEVEEGKILQARLKNLEVLLATMSTMSINSALDASEYYDAIGEKAEVEKAIADSQALIDAYRNWKPSDFGSDSSKSKKSYEPSTEESALKALYDSQEINLETYLQRLLALEKLKYSEYSKMSAKELEDALRSRNEKVAKKASEYLSLKGTISGLQDNQISILFENANDALKDLDNELSKLGNIDTIQEQTERTEIWQKKLRIVVDEILRIDRALQNASGLSSSQIELLENKKTELEILRASLTDSLVDSGKSKLDAIETVEKKIIEIIKKRYEEEAKAREKDYNDEKKELQDSLDAYKDYIQGRIDALDRLHETEDYNKQVNEQTQKIADLQSEIDKYSLAAGSGDMDAQNRVNELLKEQTEERNKLSEMQTDRERDLQKQSLQDQLKNYEKFTKKQEDLLDEEYESYRDNLEKMTSDVALYTEAQKIMANSTFEELTSMYLTFENNFGQGMSLLGDIIENEFISKLEVAKNALSDLNSLTGNKIEKSDNTSLEMAKERIGQLQTLWRKTDNEALRLKYNEEAERLRKKYGLSFQDLRGYRAKIYDTGGWLYPNQTAINLSGKPEPILDPKTASAFFNFTDMLKKIDITKMFNFNAPSIPSFANSMTGGGISNSFVFNVAGNVDKSTANSIVEQVCREQRIQLNKLGIFKK